MRLFFLHALLLASAAAAVAPDNDTGRGNVTTAPVLCNGAGCEPPVQPLPIYGGPPPSPSLPSTPSTPLSPGTQASCPPVTVVCCGGQNTPQQPYYYAPPTVYDNSASPPVVLPAPLAAVSYYVTVAYLLLWVVV